MHACAGDFACGKESWQAAAPIKIRPHTPHQVVSGRPNRYKIYGDIYVVLKTGLINAGETILNVLFFEVGQIQINNRLLQPTDFQLMGDGTGNDIAWRQLSQVVVLVHETLQFRIAQDSTFATQSFRKEKP